METRISLESLKMLLVQTRRRFRLTIILLACLAGFQRTPVASAQQSRFLLAPPEQSWTPAAVALGNRNLPVAFENQAMSHIALIREPSLWQAYSPYISVALVLLLAQTMLILELLRQRKKERIIRRHLRESEARLREAQSIAQCGSWVWDISRNKTYWSDEMYRILGLIPQSVPPTSGLIHPGDDQYYVTKMKEASDMRQLYSAEHRIVWPNGEERIVLESGQPKYDEQQRLVSIVGTLLDVTEQRRAERVLRESEDRFRTMADGAPAMMSMPGTAKLC